MAALQGPTVADATRESRRPIVLMLAASLLPPSALAVPARAQSVTIPLSYLQPASTAPVWRLGITVGINGGTPQPYLFDTGSSVLNAVVNPSTWSGSGNAVPGVTTPTPYCYGSNLCFSGTLVQAPALSFYAANAAAGSTPAATLSASPGFQINAISSATITTPSGTSTQTFPAYFQSGTQPPPYQGAFYGIFGAGNFATTQQNGALVGGVLGQAIVPNVQSQGYVVSANGQSNPATSTNPPTGNLNVSIGGVSQPLGSCVACVTLGLTPQLIGQFGPVNSVVPWAQTGPAFPNPYGSGTGNSSSTEAGVKFTTSLTTGGSTNGTTTSSTLLTLLDSGTPNFNLSGPAFIGANGGTGATISMTGVTPTDGAIAGIQTTTAQITADPSANPATYSVNFNPNANPNPNVLGIGFFMQNSVMFNLSGQAIGYTPFYVSTANVSTASGSLLVGSQNVALGLAGVISGPGGVTVGSGGALQLSATNSYTGITTINPELPGSVAGKLLISGPGSIASSSGVVNNGVFDISGAWPSNSQTAVVGIQSLSGSGQVNLGGQNLAIADGSGTFSGTMADGGYYGGSGGSLTVSGGAVTFAGTGTFTGGTSVTGGTLTLTSSLASPVTILGGSFVNHGTLGANLANFASATNNGTINGGVFNSGIFANNSGGTINGNVLNNGSFANNGTVNGSYANTNAATLSGNGRITGDAPNAGTISPGNSIGTLSIGGSHAHLGSGVYLAEVASNGQSDLIQVGGVAALQGGLVSVYAQPGTSFAPRTTYRILTAAGGVTGTYASVIDPYPFLQTSLSYDANNAYLTVQMGGFAAAAANANQSGVGRALDANVNTASGDFAQVLSSMATNTMSSAQAHATLTALSGQNYSSFSSTMVQGAQLFMNNFSNQTGGGGSPASNRVALAEVCDIACDMNPPATWGAWGGALGGLGTIGANTGTGAVTYNVGGFAAGLDRMVAPGLRVGVTTGYTTGTQWTSGFSGNGMTDTFLAGLYGGYRQDKVYADAVLGYAYSYNQMWRQIFIPGLQPRTAQGRAGSNQFYGQIEVGYRFDIGPVGTAAADAYITPFVRWQGYTGTQNGFTETGAQSLNLTVAGQTTNSLRSVIGAQLGGAIDLGWRDKLAMQIRLGWSHEYAGTSRPVTATLGGAPLMPFTTYGIAPTRDGAVVGFSANTAIADGTSAYIRYEGNISGQDSAHALSAGVRMTW